MIVKICRRLQVGVFQNRSCICKSKKDSDCNKNYKAMVTLEATKQSNQVDLNAMFGKAARVLGNRDAIQQLCENSKIILEELSQLAQNKSEDNGTAKAILTL